MLEIMLVVAIVLVALGAFYSQTLGSGSGVAPAAIDALPALVENARTVAAGSGDGATVTFVQFPSTGAGRESFEVALFADRPNPGSSFAPVPLRSERFSGAFRASLGAGPFALFISSSGTASFANWTVGSPPLQTEPACTAPLYILVAGNATAAQNAPLLPQAGPRNGIARFELDCGEARLQPL